MAATPLGHIKWKVEELAMARGLTNQMGTANLRAIKNGTGLSYTIVWGLIRASDPAPGTRWHHQRVFFSTLAALCEFFECQPGDLLEYVPFQPSTTPLSDQYKERLNKEQQEVWR